MVAKLFTTKAVCKRSKYKYQYQFYGFALQK